MNELEEKFAKEACSFDTITRERERNNLVPDLRVDFVNTNFYNNIWRDSTFLRQEFGSRSEWVIDNLKKDNVNQVLEFGCGNGWLSLELARAGFSVTALDISSECIRFAESYFNSLEENKNLSLRYVCGNILEYEDYNDGSVVCFGSLHHLPPVALKEVISRLWQKMNPGQILIAVEPRYDHTSYEMALLIYALRLALPNHFKHEGNAESTVNDVDQLISELSEAQKDQSEMDNESGSDVIVEVIQNTFGEVELKYCTSFFDKIIGSIRVDQEDTKILSGLLKQLDDIVTKYNHNFARVVMIKAQKK